VQGSLVSDRTGEDRVAVFRQGDGHTFEPTRPAFIQMPLEANLKKFSWGVFGHFALPHFSCGCGFAATSLPCLYCLEDTK
jgi:hypothetical protein